MEAQFRVQSAPWNNSYGVYVTSSDGKTYVKEVILENREEGRWRDSSFHLSQEQAQILMDDLWHCGIRPTEGSGSAGSLRATESHLNDLRKIAFHALKMENK